MRPLRRWTEASALNTMKGIYYHPSSCQGTGHAIVVPARLFVCLVLPQLVGTLDKRSAPRLFRLLLEAPCSPVADAPSRPGFGRRASRPISDQPTTPWGRRADRPTPWPIVCSGVALVPLMRQAVRRPLAVRPGRHAHAALRPLRPGGRRPSQPYSRAGGRTLPLRPRLGNPGLVGPAHHWVHVVPAAVCFAVRPRQRCPRPGQGDALGLPHQTGTGGRVGPLAEAVVGRTGKTLWLVADGAYAKKPFLQPVWPWGSWCSAACARMPICATCRHAAAAGTARTAAHLWQTTDRPGQAGWPSKAAGNGWCVSQ